MYIMRWHLGNMMIEAHPSRGRQLKSRKVDITMEATQILKITALRGCVAPPQEKLQFFPTACVMTVTLQFLKDTMCEIQIGDHTFTIDKWGSVKLNGEPPKIEIEKLAYRETHTQKYKKFNLSNLSRADRLVLSAIFVHSVEEI